MHKTDLYEHSYTDTNHFSFGKNWQNFLTTMNQERIEEAEKSLLVFLGGKENIAGKTFVDIGCGSGLFSLAAYRLGAKKVVSVDIDDFSLSCVNLVRKKEGNPPNWEIQKGSALDSSLITTLGTFDIVYSWGVLHHTGNMYQAIKNVSNVVKTDGKLYIAIYNDNQIMSEGTSNFWLTIKTLYNKSPWIFKKAMQAAYTSYYILGLFLNGKNPLSYIKDYQSLRGMDFMTDIKDWLGGYPYEYATSDTIIAFYEELGFRCEKITPARSIGCNEFLFVKKWPTDEVSVDHERTFM